MARKEVGKALEAYKEVKLEKKRTNRSIQDRSGLVRVVDVRTGGSEKRRLSPLEAEGLSMSTLVTTLLIYAFS